MQRYLPAQTASRFPTLLRPKSSSGTGGHKGFESEREILYQVLFDMRRDVTELKKLVHDIMEERGVQAPIQHAKDQSLSYLSNSILQDTGAISTVSPITTVSPATTVNMTPRIDTEVQDTEEYVEENLSLDEVEKEMIKKALERHHGKRKSAAKDLKISERTLYRKIKEYGLE